MFGRSTNSKNSELFTLDDFKKDTFDIRAVVDRITSNSAQSLPNVSDLLRKVGTSATSPEFSLILDTKQFHQDPFLREFDRTIAELEELRETSDDNVLDSAKRTRTFENDHSSNVQKLNSVIETAFASFRKLDKRIAKIARTAMSASHVIDAAAQTKVQNQFGKTMIQHFVNFNTGSRDNIDTIFETRDPIKIHEAAKLIQLLSYVIRELTVRVKTVDSGDKSGLDDRRGSVSLTLTVNSDKDKTPQLKSATPTVTFNTNPAVVAPSPSKELVPSLDPFFLDPDIAVTGPIIPEKKQETYVNAIELIAEISTDIENTMKEQMLHAIKASYYSKAYKIAITLSGFKNHTFDYYVASVTQPIVKLTKLDVDKKFVTKAFNAAFSKLCKGIVDIVTEQYEVVPKIFPHPQQLLADIASVLFENHLQPFIEVIFKNPVITANDAKCLKVIAIVHEQTKESLGKVLVLLEDMYTKDKNGVYAEDTDKSKKSKKGGDDDDNPDNNDDMLSYQKLLDMSVASIASDSRKKVNAMKTHIRVTTTANVEETIDIHNPSSSDLQAIMFKELSPESSVLRENTLKIFTPYTEQWSQLEFNLLETAMTTVLDSINDSRMEQCPEGKSLLRKPIRIPMTPEAHQAWLQSIFLNIDTIDTLLKMLTLAIRRSEHVSQPSMRAEHVDSLFILVVTFVYQKFILPLVQEAVTLVPPEYPRTEPDHFIFTIIKSCMDIDTRVQRFFMKYVLPVVQSNPNIRSMLENKHRMCRLGVENLLMACLNSFITSVLNYIKRTLSNRPSNYYKPRDGSSVTDAKLSNDWIIICQCIESVAAAAVISLQGLNVDNFLLVFGSHVYEIVIDYIKTCGGVSTLGAGLLVRDILDLQRSFRDLHITRLDNLLNDLRMLCNIFFIEYDSIRAFLTESVGTSKIDYNLILTFVKARSDFSQHKAELLQQVSFATQMK